MTNPPNVTPEMLELLERRLAENVGDRVERTLKVRYAGIVATVLFVLGLAGYSWIENLVVKAIGPVSKDAERTIAEMSWQLDLARENKKKLDALVEQITTDADAAQRRIESFQARLTKQQEEFDTTLASINDQLGAVVVRRRELEADLQQNRTSVVADLAATRADVANLAGMTAELAELAGSDRPELAERVAKLQALSAALVERAAARGRRREAGHRVHPVRQERAARAGAVLGRGAEGRRLHRAQRGPDAQRRPRGALLPQPGPRRGQRPGRQGRGWRSPPWALPT